MKNVFKKLTATAMAFTLLGTGTAVTQIAVPNLANSVTASAATVYTTFYYPKCSKNHTSIVDALKEIGVESNYNYRKNIAAANGISGYSGTGDQNTQLLSLLKQGKLKNPEYQPAPSIQNDVTKIFSDVKSGEWYVSAIQFVYDNKIMAGISSSKFCPAQTTTRGEFINALYNLEGRPSVTFNKNRFNDVQWYDPYANAIMWATNKNLASGTANGLFSPNAAITREQIAVTLYKYANFKKYNYAFNNNILNYYSDSNKIHYWAKDAMIWAVTNGVIAGKGNGILDPLANTTRAECAQMIYNFKRNIAK